MSISATGTTVAATMAAVIPADTGGNQTTVVHCTFSAASEPPCAVDVVVGCVEKYVGRTLETIGVTGGVGSETRRLELVTATADGGESREYTVGKAWRGVAAECVRLRGRVCEEFRKGGFSGDFR